jgi:anti-anti-sigma regulatory factor
VAGATVDERIIAARGAGRLTIGLRGAFDGAAVDALREVACAAIDPGMDLVVDMLEVTAIGAEGLAALDAVANFARTEGGSFLLRPPVANKELAEAVVAVAASPLEVARLDHPAGRGG